MAMRWQGALWGAGGAPVTVEKDAAALAAAGGFLVADPDS